MSHVERHHSLLREAYEKLSNELPNDLPDDLLCMACHSVNFTDYLGPEGLWPTLFVFAAIPRPTRNAPAPQQTERAKSIDRAMYEVSRVQTRRELSFAAKYRGPYGWEKSQLDALQYGAPVRVYRNKSKTWEGPFNSVVIVIQGLKRFPQSLRLYPNLDKD